MSDNILAIIIIGLFIFLPLLIGTMASKESIYTVEDFFLQSRTMGTIPTFFTVSATWWSSFAFLGSSAFFYMKGPVYWTGIAWNILFGILYFVVGKRIWYYGKKNKYITPSDFFKGMYGSETLTAIVTFVMVIFTLPYLQIQLLGGAYLIQMASNGLIPWQIGGLLFYVIIVIYLWAGGLRAVAWADVFFGSLIFIGMLFGGIVLVKYVGGITNLFETILEINPKHLYLPGRNGDGGKTLWLVMFIMTPVGAMMGPQMWLRMYAVKNKRTFEIMPFLLSLSAIVYFGTMLSGNVGVILEPNIQRPDMIFPYMVTKYLNLPVATFLLCCGSAAALSTANSQIHAISCIYSIDIHKKYFNKQINERELVTIGKWTILVFSLVAYIMLIKSPGLLVNIGLIALSGTAQIFVPVIGALFWKKSTSKGAILGILIGILTLAISIVLFNENKVIYSGLFALLINAIVFVAVSFVDRNNSIEKANLEYEKEIMEKA